ncbi:MULTISPECIES: hypothetical protein [Acinetobacter]|uniref:hypothetical protein n=1 Tax=Acinetobacter TaxID=469 RepID=UPI0004F53B11|nr:MULTISPECIES: hypothetical protein [Acinetobacter]DAI74959.1 MAG TPA: hypothetical protein [Caudoviricetes sp.]AUT33668.1 hypothetical protein C2U64_07350 [Acinetobacter pittii]MCU4466746.1 hypothetical protein [Acinetobacter pittii]MCU4554696.1 hypothetical protein [Acinetobacter pittii]MDA3494466.1 hypothetical protein [Acinetobacter sp. AOR33_HL]
MQIQIIGGLANGQFVDELEMKNPNYEKRYLEVVGCSQKVFYVDKNLNDEVALKLILINECT